jgi:hypothetical protein
MNTFFERSQRFLDLPLETPPRVLLLAALLMLAPAYLAPLWKLTMSAPQYPNGLRMDIYSWKLQGGHEGHDLEQINDFNRQIGMRELTAGDFSEFKWIPFVLGALGLLFLRASVLGRTGTLLDLFVLYVYFGLFAFWSFAYKLYLYGHDLAPMAAVKVEPFMPPLAGHKQLPNLDVYSSPAVGSYALAAVAVLLGLALFLARREGRRSLIEDARAAG